MDGQRITTRALPARWMPVLLILLSRTMLGLASPVQFCAVDKKHNVDQCIVASWHRNSSTGEDDLQLYLSAKFEERKGYAAFGTGSLMHGSLMFIIYPGLHAGDATFSLRTTHFHNPPQIADNTPSYSVISTSVDGLYHNVEIMCHSCGSWSENTLSATSDNQPWVFANNYEWIMQSDEQTKPLTLHTFYDSFHLNMKISHSGDGEIVQLRLINNDRTSLTGLGEPSGSSPRQQLSIYVVHGVALGFAFLVLIPSAVIIIRSGHKSSFSLHWMTQAVSATIVASGIGLGIYSSQISLEISSAREIHQLFGLLLFLGLLVAPSLGYLHHVRYLKLGRRTVFSEWHRRVGYISMIGGWANTLLGLYVAGNSSWLYLAATGWCVLLVISFWVFPICSQWRTGRLYQSYVRLNQLSE